MKLELSGAWAYEVQGWVHYQRNDLAMAEESYRGLVPLAHGAHGQAAVDGFTGLVLTAMAQGRPQEALAAIAMLRELLLEWRMLAYDPVVDSLQQRVALAWNPSSACDWRYGGSTAQIPVQFWEQPVLTYVCTLLVRSAPDGLAQAAELLADCRAKATAHHSNRKLIEVAALEALVHAAQGNEDTSLAALQQAVELAAPGTVRKHTMHIYTKLGVNNRRAAAAQARRLNLI